MHEDGAAQTRHWRIVVMTEYNNYVVEVVVAPHLFSARRKWESNHTVVTGINRIITPAVSRLNRTDGPWKSGQGQLVGTVKHTSYRPITGGRSPITLSLIEADSCSSQCTR